jgi:uncharacterized protein YjbJ (UPF0337 family)
MKDKAKGKLEEIKGKVTGDQAEEMKGKARQAAGEAKRIGRDARDEFNERIERKDDPDRS